MTGGAGGRWDKTTVTPSDLPLTDSHQHPDYSAIQYHDPLAQHEHQLQSAEDELATTLYGDSHEMHMDLTEDVHNVRSSSSGLQPSMVIQPDVKRHKQGTTHRHSLRGKRAKVPDTHFGEL